MAKEGGTRVGNLLRGVSGPVLGAVGSAATAIWGEKARRKGQREQRAHEMALAEYAYNKDLEMWHRQNEYNMPSAQMERFGAAGLNPHLIYGQGTPGQAMQMPQYNAPRAEYDYNLMVNPLEALNSYMGIDQRLSQINLTKAQANVQKTMDVLSSARADGVLQENTIRSLEATIAKVILMDYGADLNEIAKGRVGAMSSDNWLRQALSEIKQWEASLTRRGINPRDSVILRMLINTLGDLGFDFEW